MPAPQVAPPPTRDALGGHGFDIGEHTYGAPRLHWWGEPATLSIGRYTSFAEGVQLFLGGNHRLDSVTTYPFSHLSAFPEAAAIEGSPATRGDIRIGSDVWIGANAMISAGVAIGDGAVVAAGSVVRRDVAPYTLVAGNPARLVRRRFADDDVARLLEVRWWDWDEYTVRLAIPHLTSSDLGGFFAFAERAGSVGPHGAPGRRVYDCFLYNGEADVLAVRLHELSPVVDWFVVVEADRTFSGLPRSPRFDLEDPRFGPFLPRIRHVVVRDLPETDDPWAREAWQRNAVVRGLDGAGPDDLLLLSDADEIPRAWAVAFMAADRRSTTFGLALALSYFYFNYTVVRGPEAAQVWSVATPRRVLDSHTPQELRTGIRAGRIGATVLQRAGWHLSYMFDRAGIAQKIREFSHQEYNNPAFLDGIDVERFVRERRDMFGNPGNVWDVVGAESLPAYVRASPERFARFILPERSAG